MAIEVKDKFKVDIKRKEHPNARKYTGFSCLEFGSALTKFLDELEPEEFDQLEDGSLIFEEEITAPFFDSIQVGDVVGLGLIKGLEKGPAPYKFEILSVDQSEDTMLGKNVSHDEKAMKRADPDYRPEEKELTFEEVSIAFGLGFGEILMRDEKPFGVSEKIEKEIVILGKKEEEPEKEETEEEPAKEESETKK